LPLWVALPRQRCGNGSQVVMSTFKSGDRVRVVQNPSTWQMDIIGKVGTVVSADDDTVEFDLGHDPGHGFHRYAWRCPARCLEAE
jgi:ribosomal protein L21E